MDANFLLRRVESFNNILDALLRYFTVLVLKGFLEHFFHDKGEIHYVSHQTPDILTPVKVQGNCRMDGGHVLTISDKLGSPKQPKIPQQPPLVQQLERQGLIPLQLAPRLPRSL